MLVSSFPKPGQETELLYDAFDLNLLRNAEFWDLNKLVLVSKSILQINMRDLVGYVGRNPVILSQQQANAVVNDARVWSPFPTQAGLRPTSCVHRPRLLLPDSSVIVYLQVRVATSMHVRGGYVFRAGLQALPPSRMQCETWPLGRWPMR
jgi:hypothetical protein